MKMVLPVDGYRSVTDFMEAIQGTQGDTYWLLKPGEYWHGGIHLYDGFAGNAVYRQGCHGLKCMTDGHVVAWRLNDDYQTAQYGDKLLKFSSTFALIKSTCIPDMNKSENALVFYTLWMQIAPLSEYGAEIPTATVTASSLKVRQDNPVEGWVRTGLPDGNIPEANSNYDAPLDSGTTLPRGSVVEIEEEATFLLSGQPQPFIFVRVKSVPDGKVSGLAAGESGWITGQDQYINRQSISLPVWMQTAREHGVFNQVVSGQSIEVKAGDVIGHLSYHERPEATPQHFCHLEVFSQDERLEDFLANKASVTAGATELHTMADKTLWQYSEDSEMFVVADIGGAAAFSTAERLTIESECHSKESGGKTWYEIPAERAWMSDDDVEKVNQFDLEKRGFIQLAEKEEPQSIFQTPEEGWLHQAFGQLAELTQNEARDGYSSGVAESYQKLLQQMDTNQDGLISANELWRYLHNTQRQIQYQVQRLVVKHHSEWLKDGMTALWQTALDEQREGYPELALYNMEYINKLVWMKDVSEIHSSEALWHMHPVVFLDAIKDTGCNCEELYADKFSVTRYGTQYGPIYWGEITLDSYTRWDNLIAECKITSDEKAILVAMSENEGKMDAVQSYDSEVITAGAMQKTVKDTRGLEGKGELSAQFAKFRDSHSDLYEKYAMNCGWTVEGTGASSVIYYSNNILTQGNKITSSALKTLLRQECSERNFGAMVHNKPLAALLKVLILPEYLDIQVLDFIERLHVAECNVVTSEGKQIKEFVKSNFGRAVVLDHSVNRPGFVAPDFTKAIENFHTNNPTVSLDPATWGNNHSTNETKLLEEYKLTRRMTDSSLRFNTLKAKL